MSTNPPDAANKFVGTLIQRAYSGAIKSMTIVLNKGPAGRGPRSKLVQLHQWYTNLAPEDQRQVLEAIREGVRVAVFGCLVVIDNKLGDYPVPGVLSDYAVYLQTYKDEVARGSDESDSAIRLNPPYSSDIDLHDIFGGLVDDD